MRGKAGRFSRFTPFTPTSLSGLTAWLDASDSTTLFDADSGGSASSADGEVGRIQDKSGNSRHFTQDTSANRPTRKTAQQNGLDVLRFDGTNDRMVTSFFFSELFNASSSSAFIVAKALSVGTNDANPYQNASILAEQSAAHGFVMLRSNDTAGSFSTDNGVSYVTPTLGYTPGNWKVFSTTHDGSVLSLSINGGSANTASTSARVNVEFNMVLGANWNFSEFLDGDVGEVITYDVALSGSDRNSVISYLMAKWGIT
jgi:hypothetical protein